MGQSEHSGASQRNVASSYTPTQRHTSARARQVRPHETWAHGPFMREQVRSLSRRHGYACSPLTRRPRKRVENGAQAVSACGDGIGQAGVGGLQ